MVFIIVAGFSVLCAGTAIFVLLAGWRSEEGHLEETLHEVASEPRPIAEHEAEFEVPSEPVPDEEALELEREHELVAVP